MSESNIFTALGLSALIAAPSAAAEFFINEFHYDNASSDVGEFIEVLGQAGTVLDGASLVLYNGSSTQRSPYNTLALTGTLPDQCDGYGTALINLPANGLQNGSPDAIALIDATGNVVEFMSYEGAFEAASGPAAGFTSTDIGVSETSSTAIGSSLQRTGDGVIGADFTWTGPAAESPGDCNVGQTFGGDPDPDPEPTGSAYFSELHYDNASSDVGEGFEVRGEAGTDLNGWRVELYNGNGGGTYGTVNLAGVLPDQCEGEGTLSFPRAGLQNGSPDGLALVNAAGELVEFISYEGVMVASNGAAAGETSTDIGVAESGSTPAGQSLQLIDGTWLDPAPDNFGECNESPSEPPSLQVQIHEIQGSGDASPIAGSVVEVTAVVTGAFQSTEALRGFYIQEADADQDADPATSEGIFVFCSACMTAVQPGDVVRVVGEVVEFNGLTELTNVSTVEVLGTAPVPAPVTINDIAATELEPLEGMHVVLPGPLTVVSNFNMRFGELGITDRGLLTQPTQIMEPGPDAFAAGEENNAAVVILDDGSTRSNPDPIIYAADGGPLTSANTVRAGDMTGDVSAIVSFGFGRYRLQPVDTVQITTVNPRPALAPNVPGEIRVASSNVLNYFTTLDARGADTAAELERQREKLITALTSMNADIIGLVEVENDLAGVADEAVADIVSAMNLMLGTDTWALVPTGAIGTDQIKVGLIYNQERIGTTGSFAILDSSVDGRFDDTKSRPALAQTFTALADGESLTVIVNHLKSKGSACADPDASDGQGNCNVTRTAAAMALADWSNTDPTGTGEADVLIVGDLNAYAKEDPIVALENAGYTNLETVFDPGSYSYTFNGQRGTLDYGLASGCLAEQATGSATWHVNADEPSILDYNLDSGRDATLFDGTTPYRFSDHDPLVMGFDLTSLQFGGFQGYVKEGREIRRRFFTPIVFSLFEDGSPARHADVSVTVTNVDTGDTFTRPAYDFRGKYYFWLFLFQMDPGSYEASVNVEGCQTYDLNFSIP